LYEEILKLALDNIRPKAEDYAKIKEAVNKVMSAVKKFSDVNPVLVGSVAKDTWLKKDTDIDIFLPFSETVEYKTVVEEGIKTGKKVAKELSADAILKYANHPYVSFSYSGYDIEIVPCYKTDRPKTPVDRTLLHTEYVKKNLRKDLKDDVRLLKAFFKGIGVYGAESKVKGFSGYLTELIIMRCGSFIDSLRYLSSLKSLSIADPIDEKRDVASAVSLDTLAKCSLACNEFLRHPSIDFFIGRDTEKIKMEDIEISIVESELHYLFLIFESPKIVEEITIPQIERFINSCKNVLMDFGILRVHYFIDTNVIISFVLRSGALPRRIAVGGPPFYMYEDVKRFIRDKKIISGPYIKDGRVFVEINQKKRARNVLVDAISNEKVSFGKNLKEFIKNSSIYENTEIKYIAEKDEKINRFVREVLRADELWWLMRS